MASQKTSAVLKSERVQSRLRKLPGWNYLKKDSSIRREYLFPTFLAAIRFVDYVAELAEVADHHPDIDVRYNRVVLTLSTHSEGGVTDKDISLARVIDHR